MTIEAEERSLRYQGIVPLSGSSLAESLEAYFASSEQLPTRVLLVADEQRAAGMLVQKLPEAGAPDPEEVAEAWEGAEQGIGACGRRRCFRGASRKRWRRASPDTTCGCFAARRCASNAAAARDGWPGSCGRSAPTKYGTC